MHDGHHANTHQLAADQLAQLSLVVVHVGGGDRLGLLAGTHGGRLDVLEGGHVCSATGKQLVNVLRKLLIASVEGWARATTVCAMIRGEKEDDRTRSKTYPSWR